MKSAGSSFLAKLYDPAGEKPLWIAKVYYDASNYFLCSTDRITIEGNTYNPWVVKFGTIRMKVDEDTFLAPPNEVEITLQRNSTTENLLGAYAKGRKVQLWCWFWGLTTFSADALTLGTFVINKVGGIGYGKFTIYCLSDESKMVEDIPKELINESDFPQMGDEINDVPWPLILGDLRNPSDSDYRYLDTYKANAGISQCVHKGDYKFLTYKHPSVSPQYGGVRAYQIEGEDRLHATIEYFDETPNWAEELDSYYRIADINPYTSGQKGYARTVRLRPNKPESDNEVSNWENAVDLDRSTVANLWPGEMKLSMTYSGNIGGIGSVLPESESNYFIAKAALNIDSLESDGTVTVKIYYGGASEVSETFSSAGYRMTTNSIAKTVPLDLRRIKITAEVNAGKTATIDGFHLWLVYWNDDDISRPKIRIEIQKRKGELLPFVSASIKEVITPECKFSQIFVEGVGPTDQSGKSWNYKHPVSILYFILNKAMDIPSGEIDVDQWHTIFQQMGISWEFAKSIYDRISPKSLLESFLHEAQLKMWRNSENKYVLFRANTAGVSPDMTFKDSRGDVYIMKDFNWGWTDRFYNKYELNYR